MDSIPLKVPQGAPQTVNEDVAVTIPDCLSILQETEVSLYVSIIVRHNLCAVLLQLTLHSSLLTDVLCKSYGYSMFKKKKNISRKYLYVVIV